MQAESERGANPSAVETIAGFVTAPVDVERPRHIISATAENTRRAVVVFFEPIGGEPLTLRSLIARPWGLAAQVKEPGLRTLHRSAVEEVA